MWSKSKGIESLLYHPKWRLFRFIFIGGWNAFFSLAFFYILIMTLGDSWYQIVLLITFIASTFQSYFMQKLFVWRKKNSTSKEFIHFFLVCTVQYLLNAGLLFLLVTYLKFSPKILQLPVAFLLALGSYIYFKNRVFRVGSESRI